MQKDMKNIEAATPHTPICAIQSRLDHQAVRTYVYSVDNFQFTMASQILTRVQLEKMSNENLIASFLALQDNIIPQQNDLLQENRDISKKLLEITSKIDRWRRKVQS